MICLLAGTAVLGGMSGAFAAGNTISNTQLPELGNGSMTSGVHIDTNGNSMTVNQGDLQNAVIQWGGGFNVGANATVNFQGNKDGYNVLNYDRSGSMSQIYGTINANNNGNVYIVNPSGVQIGSSAQINVGSLYVSNKDLSSVIENINGQTDMKALIAEQQAGAAELMSLGNINATNVTFDGGRIVIDTERLKNGDDRMAAGDIHVITTDADNVVLGYTAYDETNNTYADQQKAASDLAKVTDASGKEFTGLKGYMWVEDIEQLQAIKDNLSGNYALRNSIDATATKDWEDGGFVSIGSEGDSFTGRLDGLDYNIFNLHIDRAGEDNVGLFGVVGSGAVVRNVSLVGGSITGGSDVGTLAGQVKDEAQISNITNSASVTGVSNVGGIIGSAGKSVFEELVNTGTIAGTAENKENNAGGLIGSLTGGTLSGTSYNLGGVTGKGSNVGGLVGTASGATLGDGTNLIYNRLNVTGSYNVGGIVGSMTGTTVQNAENSGNVTAAGYMTGDYSYHTARDLGDGKTVDTVTVTIANAGGIAGTASDGSKIFNVQNSGDVSSSKQAGKGYYDAGNVGGIAGSAVDTNISDAANEENDIRGAHNVGGIAGYFGSTDTADSEYTITRGINSGGDIMATGARNEANNGFVKESVRSSGEEEFIVGNMGGIAGYMDGDAVYIVSGANRGTVHTAEFDGLVPDYAMAANAGGIVGKIDRAQTLGKDDLSTNYENAAVSNSYNTGDVMGYTGVGGIAGMMYSGEIAGSYNLGYISTTRKNGEGIAALNMGGIVGDTTEQSNAEVLLYDVYNEGQIGDEDFNYYARHVGGIVGRLSGDVEKAYNTGAIYNGSDVVGGIAGWMYKGSITNAFNTGNITVSNKNTATSQVGGIVGAANLYEGDIVLKNIYNLGTLRSFTNNGSGKNSIGGIIGEIFVYGSNGNPGNLQITNAYTLGNIYSDTNYDSVHPMLGTNSSSRGVSYKNTYYIQPETTVFKTLTEKGVTSIAYDNRHNQSVWEGFSFSDQTDGDVNIAAGEDWRIYDGNSLPILNAFLPKAEDYFSDENHMDGISSIQYGTAYDPLLTIIRADADTGTLTFNGKDLGISNAAGIAVYGAGLTLNDFAASGGSGYFGGLIYSDGALAINAHTSGEVTGDVALGSAAQLYGSSVSISADGNVTIYGNVTATGNTANGATSDVSDSISVAAPGNISITGGSVDVYGQLTSAEEGKTTTVPGIDGKSDAWTPAKDEVSGSGNAMKDLGERFGYTTGESAVNGNISITTQIGDSGEDGHLNVYYGHQQKGFLDTAGNLIVQSAGDVYMDSDLSVGGNLTISGPGELVLDISNIGKVQAEDSLTGLHNFLHHFDKTGGTGTISFAVQDSTAAADAKITVDMWDEDTNAFNLNQYDSLDHKLVNELNDLNFSVSGAENVTAEDYTYIWVSTGEQLAGIQQAAEGNSSFLGYNFTLKNDIDASAVEDYKAIATDSAFTGTFDGRDNRIIGLNVTGSNAGIFDTVGEGGKVEDLRIYSGTFEGTDNAGAVAGINHGTISDVTTFGNVVTAEGSTNSTKMPGDEDDKSVHVGAAGGIAGVNAGVIADVSVSDAVTAADDADGALSTAGGIAGINMDGGKISDSSSNSAVNASAESTYALGGIAGVNVGELSNVESFGVTTGIYEAQDSAGTRYSDNVGGIAGRNSGTVSEAYNESIVSGRDNVGGIIGVNTAVAAEGEGSPVRDVSNAARVTGEAASGETSGYVGGLVGANSGSITNGRNNGTITGNDYVGGLVGNNGENSVLENLVNDSAAAITGNRYVGGIAGSNSGIISADAEQLINRGTITGQMYVGGVAGENTGTIRNTDNDVDLYVKDSEEAAEYFGGVAGINKGTITRATNHADVHADEALYVGGLVGRNEGTLAGMNGNYGTVSGKGYVGGVAGENTKDITDAEAVNQGSVIATGEDGGAGGLFGVNSGNITNSSLSNDGRVEGSSHVGGLIGENSGNISTSSLTNSVNGTVTGKDNVGGLIGSNSGTITGGRAADEDGNDIGYYTYKIYNNGTVTAAESGSNIGGLFGTNSGKVTAAYNTGAVAAENSTNVGGIAGTNTGTLDQVFNTVMTGSGENQTVTGKSNVGGIAGYNEGTISNAYNTTAVNGATAGGIAGVNNGSISTVYTTAGSAVSGFGADAENGYVLTKESAMDAESYENFGFDTTDSFKKVSEGGEWQIYDGSSLALLKVFLTKAEVTDPDLVYNGQEQFIGTDSITAADGGVTMPPLGQNSHKDAGSYDNWLYSSQIASGTAEDGTFDPNHLGYDIVYSTESGGTGDGTIDIDKAQITVDLDEVHRIYGDTAFTDDTNYGFTYNLDNAYADEETQNTLKGELDGNLSLIVGKDGALTENGTKTNDAGNHTWTGTVSVSDDLSKNYEFVLNGFVTGSSITSEGASIVKQRHLTVSDIIASIVYGNQDGKGFTISGGTLGNVVYDDDVSLSGSFDVTDSSIVEGSDYAKNKGDRTTADVGTYENSLSYSGLTLTGDKAGNYTIDGTAAGKIQVTQATITVDLSGVERTYGSADITKGSYGISKIEGLVNGDGGKYDENNFTLDESTIIDGALAEDNNEGRVTNNANKEGESYTYTGKVSGDVDTVLNTNYIINVTGEGKSTVNKADLTIDLKDVERVYGSKDLSGNFAYGVDGMTGLVNGDKEKYEARGAVIAEDSIKDSALAEANEDGRVTNNVGDQYFYSGTVSLDNVNLDNYSISYTGGKSEITKATLDIKANDTTIDFGQNPVYTGTDINEILVNGDTLTDYEYGVLDDSIETKSGLHPDSIGVWIGGSYYESSNARIKEVLGNYDVTINPGDLTVGYGNLPDTPDPWWDHLYKDAPFDREKDFRERKAEIRIVAGGMSY